jgi:hypothetical protein
MNDKNLVKLTILVEKSDHICQWLDVHDFRFKNASERK